MKGITIISSFLCLGTQFCLEGNKAEQILKCVGTSQAGPCPLKLLIAFVSTKLLENSLYLVYSLILQGKVARVFRCHQAPLFFHLLETDQGSALKPWFHFGFLTGLVITMISPSLTVSSLFPGSAAKSYITRACTWKIIQQWVSESSSLFRRVMKYQHYLFSSSRKSKQGKAGYTKSNSACRKLMFPKVELQTKHQLKLHRRKISSETC